MIYLEISCVLYYNSVKYKSAGEGCGFLLATGRVRRNAGGEYYDSDSLFESEHRRYDRNRFVEYRKGQSR